MYDNCDVNATLQNFVNCAVNAEVNALRHDVQNFAINFDVAVFYALIFITFTLIFYNFNKIKKVM